MDPGADPAMGMGMGMEGMDDEELPILAGAARPWLSTTGILALLTVFLITLVGIIIFSFYLYFLQAKLECPECKAADVAKFTKKKATTTTTSTEPALRQVLRRGKMSRQQRRHYQEHYRLRRLRSLLLMRLSPYYRARLHSWLWRWLRLQAALRLRILHRSRRRPVRLLRHRRPRRRLYFKGSWSSIRLRRKRPNWRSKRKWRSRLRRSQTLLPRPSQ
ncbi:uncharacterized protein LOC144118957 [Amblyomma americanum]